MQWVFMAFLDSCPLLLFIFDCISVHKSILTTQFITIPQSLIIWYKRYKDKHKEISSFNNLVKTIVS